MKIGEFRAIVRANRRRLTWWALSIVLAYTMLGFLILPAIVRWQLRKQLSERTHRKSTIEAVRLNPYAFSLTLRELRLDEPDGKPFASLGELYINFDPFFSLFTWSWDFSEISVKQPAGWVVRNPDGAFNFSNMFSKATNAPPSAGTSTRSAAPRTTIDKLRIEDGSFDFNDLSRALPFHHRFAPIRVGLDHFRTKPNTDNPYSFVASTGSGESFTYSGDVSVNPPRSSGTFKLEGI